MLHTTLPTRRVFILGDNALFEEGLAKLLTYGTNLSVKGATYTDDLSFLDAIEQHQSDVILLNEESTSLDAAHILDLIFSTPSLTVLYIIIVRLDSSMVDVYENEIPKRFLITKQDELVAVVQGNFQEK